MGKALLELTAKMRGRKLDDGKALGGKGRLTKKLIDRIQNNYGYAIRNNVGNIDNMYNAIWAVFYHSIIQPSMNLDEQHDLCPRQSWCNYWTDKENYTESRRLPVVFADLLKSIFTRLSNRTLLSRCQGGYTQNQNESINNVLWTRCLKTKFCGYNKVYLAVCDTVSHFNAGAAAKATVMKKMGLTIPASTLSFVRKNDSTRIKNAAYKISMKARKERQRLRSQRKSKADKISYAAGSFGLTTKPEKYTKEKKCKRKRKLAEGDVSVPQCSKKQKIAKPPSTPTGPVILFVDDKNVQFIKKLC